MLCRAVATSLFGKVEYSTPKVLGSGKIDARALEKNNKHLAGSIAQGRTFLLAVLREGGERDPATVIIWGASSWLCCHHLHHPWRHRPSRGRPLPRRPLLRLLRRRIRRQRLHPQHRPRSPPLLPIPTRHPHQGHRRHGHRPHHRRLRRFCRRHVLRRRRRHLPSRSRAPRRQL